MATEVENHFTVFIRLPFNRGSFVDPPPVAWSATKEKDLWEIISRQSKGNAIDWKKLADQFEVSQPFLLQQAAWLYERQLSQVRAQMRRMGSRQSASASPVPPSATASVVTAQTMRRGGSISSRAPSRLSTQNLGTATAGIEAVSSPTPIKSRGSLPARSSGTVVGSQTKSAMPTRNLSRKSSKDNEPMSRTNSRRGSVQQQISRSPVELEPPEQSSSDDEGTTSKVAHRRSNPLLSHRRVPSLRKSQHARQQSIEHVDEETEEDESPAFLPLATDAENRRERGNPNTSAQDPSATLRGGLNQTSSTRPSVKRNLTSERIRANNTATATTSHAINPALNDQIPHNLNSSASSNDGPFQSTPVFRQTQNPSQMPRRGQSRAQIQLANATSETSPNLPTPLSPRQQAALAQAGGLLPRSPRPRRPNHTQTGSESSPSMGSSFSDLDDASVTQSALEEALMSGMGSVATTAGGNNTTGALAGVGALGSRMSGISQALRSRYFDARSGTANVGNANTRAEGER